MNGPARHLRSVSKPPPVTPVLAQLQLLAEPHQLPDGRQLSTRVAHRIDLPAVRAMHRRCSDHSLAACYEPPVRGRPSDAEWSRLTGRGAAFALATTTSRPEEIVALTCLSPVPGRRGEVRLTMLVEDRWQDLGLGRCLLQYALTLAAARQLPELTARTHAHNTRFINLACRSGATVSEASNATVTLCIPAAATPLLTRRSAA